MDGFTMHPRGKAIRTSYGLDVGEETVAKTSRATPGLGDPHARNPLSHLLLLWPIAHHIPQVRDNGVLTCPPNAGVTSVCSGVGVEA